MEGAWYAVEAKPHKTDLIVASLRHQGVVQYQPRLEIPARRHARAVPLFPGYLFVWIDSVRDSVRVRYTPGVRRLVGCGDRPTPIGQEVVDFIRAREGSDGLIRPTELFDFEPNQRARVRGGVLDGLEVLFQSYLPDGKRVEILLEVLGRQVRTVIPADRLLPTYV